MSRYIDIEPILEWCDNPEVFEPYGVNSVELERKIREAPTIEARPKGEWIVYEGGWKDLDYYPPKCKCNQCGYEEELYILNAKPTNFCPHCGADMRERKDFQVIVNGNCTKCGKPLSGNRIFICEECEEQSKESE